MRVIMRVLLVCAAVSVLVLSGCAGGGGTALKVGQEANGSTVRLTVGQTLEVALPANPTTGYDWAVDGALPSQLTSVSDSYESTAPAGVAGAGGVHTFVYKAVADGADILKLGYRRPWETGVEPLERFEIQLEILKPGI